ncbi:MAG: gamma carbonic anhydrase family protein [Leptotrichiaceae bacterium]|nr:gamma carbonic anhydrase family protein [Leptotrichiaceae bacterium]
MIYELDGISPVIGKEVFIAESADVIGNVELRDRVNIWFGAVLRGDVEKIAVGKNSNVQDNCTIHTDLGYPCIIGENVTVGHNVILHGCEVSDNVIVGMGSTLLNGVRIASDCLIGANSLVTDKIPYEKGVLILGSPAKIIRKLTDEEIAHIRKNAEHYAENGKKFHKALKKCIK